MVIWVSIKKHSKNQSDGEMIGQLRIFKNFQCVYTIVDMYLGTASFLENTFVFFDHLPNRVQKQMIPHLKALT